MSRLSGWCATPPGIEDHASAHRVCEMRQRDGLLPPCLCEAHGGHTTTEDDE